MPVADETNTRYIGGELAAQISPILTVFHQKGGGALNSHLFFTTENFFEHDIDVYAHTKSRKVVSFFI
jgi:hypothetical protein